MKTILFIHQSAELYGSDKTLLFLVDKIQGGFKPIVVVPNEGPLTDIFKVKKITYIVSPVIKISRSLFSLKGIISLPFKAHKAIKQLKIKLGNQKIDIIHSNTLAVLLGAFYSRKYKIKHIWHVHEIIKKPKIVAVAYPYLVNFFSNTVVFNSKASFNQLCSKHNKLKTKSIVIYNGLDREFPPSNPKEIENTRKKLFSNVANNTLIIGLIGRISKMKGQQFLLNTFEELSKNHNHIKLVFIGSTIPSQEYLLDEINTQIKKKNFSSSVSIIPFQENIWLYYDSIDILIIPTTIPEPFGLVALEGMLSNKPVIAANHGGLIEIISHNDTGLLFKANNKQDLILKIEKLINNIKLKETISKNGKDHALTAFSLNKYIINFTKLYQKT
jgi:glycosyltransferase involved in cell wall biosynthesis